MRLAVAVLLLLAAACSSPQRASESREPLPSLAVPSGEDPSRWAEDMARFEAEDAERPVEPGAVVFVGSSSIRLWGTLHEGMAPYRVVQRGFGGSRLFDACYWSERLVTVHEPSAVVLFSGTNDIAGDAPKSASRVAELFDLFVVRVRARDPELPIAYIAITPTPSRARHLAIVNEANRLIRERCEGDSKLTFIDPARDLTTSEGQPDPSWFLEDRLHLNAAGYEVWTRHVRPYVRDQNR